MSSGLLRRVLRLGAGQFWRRILGTALTSLVFAVLVGTVTGIGLVVAGATQATQDVVLAGSGAIVGLQALYGQLAVAAARCRAVGRSSWWCLLLVVPLVGPLLLLVDLTFRPFGEQGPAS